MMTKFIPGIFIAGAMASMAFIAGCDDDKKKKNTKDSVAWTKQTASQPVDPPIDPPVDTVTWTGLNNSEPADIPGTKLEDPSTITWKALSDAVLAWTDTGDSEEAAEVPVPVIALDKAALIWTYVKNVIPGYKLDPSVTIPTTIPVLAEWKNYEGVFNIFLVSFVDDGKLHKGVVNAFLRVQAIGKSNLKLKGIAVDYLGSEFYKDIQADPYAQSGNEIAFPEFLPNDAKNKPRKKGQVLPSDFKVYKVKIDTDKLVDGIDPQIFLDIFSATSPDRFSYKGLTIPTEMFDKEVPRREEKII